jgi:hypothetical protein
VNAPSRSWLTLGLLASLAATGCLDHDLPEDAQGVGSADTFIALPRDFCDFREWMAFPLRDIDMHAGVTGPLVVYLKDLPPMGAEAFPVGTMIVKTVELGDPKEWEIHAMVKRGGTFNSRGAIGWEFFDLGIDDDCTPVIHWRGEKAPRDHGYKSLPGLKSDDASNMDPDCNSCHGRMDARENDAVLSEPLRLKDLS